jgi:hypothetical protein
MRVKRNTTCRKDGWVRRPDYAVGCTTDKPQVWEYDHFHAIVDGQPCDCRHDTGAEARAAHGQPTEP